MSTRTTAARTPRLAEVQALRAIAVLMVLLFHLWPDALTGGYAGVDVFFVISGFLITGHLLREREATGTVSLRHFWARRIVRLLPAALLVLACTLIAAWAWLPVTRWQATATDVAASALQVENWWVAAQAVDYFAAAQAASPVQHYWSLSVEEQFYLAWPLLVLLAAARRTRPRPAVAAMLVVVFAASLAWSWLATGASPATAYFSTWTRAWAFAAGGLLAVARQAGHAPPAPSSIGARAGSLLGLAGLVVTATVFDGGTPFPGLAALLPVAATLLVIACGLPAGLLSPAPLLCLRAMQWLGHVAYPLYLWHWPLVVLAPHALGHAPGHAARGGLLLLTLVLAAATSTWLEHRVRDRAAPGRATWPVYGGALAACLVVLAGAGLLWRAGTPDVSARTVPTAGRCVGADAMRPGRDCPGRFRAAPRDAILAARDDGGALWLHHRAERDPAYARDCRFIAEKTQACAFVPFRAPALRLVLAGDSHMLQHLPAIAALARANRWNVSYHLSLGCPVSVPTPAFAGEAALRASCRDWRARLPAALARRDDVDLVLTNASTRRYGRDYTPAQQAPLADGFVRTWQAWTQSGKRVLVVVDNPLSATVEGTPVSVPDCLAAAGGAEDACALPRARALPRDPVDLALARGVPGVSALDLSWAFCDMTTCHYTVGGLVTHFDADHVTARFNLTLMPELGEAILRAAGRDPSTLVLPTLED